VVDQVNPFFPVNNLFKLYISNEQTIATLMSNSNQQQPSSNFAYPIPSDYSQPQPGSSSSSTNQPTSRQAAEDARKDRTLAEFLLMLDEYEPLVRPSFLCHIDVSSLHPDTK